MIRRINYIPFRPDYDVIFSQLGYKKTSTQLTENFRKEIKMWIDEAASFIRLEALIKICNLAISIEDNEEKSNLITISQNFVDNEKDMDIKNPSIKEESSLQKNSVPIHHNQITIKSNSLIKFLKESKKIVIMGITGGIEIMDIINKYQNENMAKAVVFDAAAGEIVDSGFDYIMSLLNRELLRSSNKLFQKRFSPGYGDLSLSVQKDFYNLLKMEQLGVKLTPSFLLDPQKSVIALTGII